MSESLGESGNFVRLEGGKVTLRSTWIQASVQLFAPPKDLVYTEGIHPLYCYIFGQGVLNLFTACYEP